MKIRLLILAGFIGIVGASLYVIHLATSEPVVLQYEDGSPDPVIVPFQFERSA